jgi:phosphoribosylglycinamide formyltransferase-1
VYGIGWLSTGRDKAARDLLKVVYDNINEGKLANLKISFIFSNRRRGEAKETDLFFELARNLGIQVISFSSHSFSPELREKGLREEKKGESRLIEDWRRLYDREIMKGMGRFGPHLLVLAGYMLILGEEICQRYSIINLHPALPQGPRGTWQEVIWKLIEGRWDQTGVMIHLVTPELDAGPPLTYCKFPIRGGRFDRLWQRMEEKLKKKSLKEISEAEGENEPLFQEIRREGVKRELPLTVHTLKLFSEGKLKVKGRRVFQKGKIISGLRVDKEICQALENNLWGHQK